MKIHLLILMCLSSVIAHGMEEPKEFSIISYGTKISVVQDLLSNRGDKVDLIVVGLNHQQIAQTGDNFGARHEVGNITFLTPTIIYERYIGDCKTKDVACSVLRIIEPFLTKQFYSNEIGIAYQFHYHYIQDSTAESRPIHYDLTGNIALERASSHLTSCYSHILTTGLTKLEKKEKKSIALPALCSRAEFRYLSDNKIGLPGKKAVPIAINAILEFIKENPSAYDRIEFIITEQPYFLLYTTLLSQIQKTYLLYCALKNNYGSLSIMPRELTNDILLTLFKLVTKK